VALGFATLENLFYVFGALNPFLVAGWRAFLSVPLHGLCGLFMGYEAARQKLGGAVTYSLFRILFLPVLVHGLFNYFLFLSSGIGVLMAVALVVVFWLKSMSVIKRSWSCKV
jgi:RsiW-degrading membrane proteinase PrsW (M82 family)